MRLLTILLALLLVPTSARAQSTEVEVLASLLVSDEEDPEDESILELILGDPVYTVLFGIVCLASCAMALLVADEPPPGDETPETSPLGAAPDAAFVEITRGIALAIQDDGTLATTAQEREATHLLAPVSPLRRGLGLAQDRDAVTVSVLDLTTRQPVALGPLGSTTATVRTADDLRALLEDR